MDEMPSKSIEWVILGDGAKRSDMKIILLKRDRMLLKHPPVLGDHARGRLELRRHGVVPADSFAETRNPEYIIADSAA